jgi:UDP-glucose 4-epimerase
VLDVIHAFEKAAGMELRYGIKGRRPGDAPAVFSDPGKAAEELGWKAEYGIEDMCRDAWNWQQKNPTGY